MNKLDICFRWQNSVLQEYNENYFLGGWHPSAILNVELKGFEKHTSPNSLSGKNWFLISGNAENSSNSTTRLHGNIAQSGGYSEAVLFSGYILDSGIHSYSSSDRILNYFINNANPSFNGVFALVRITEFGRNIEIRTDAFGITPLYYRIYKNMFLFSSNPRFLRLDDDTPDLIAWRCLIQSRTICSDRTLSNEVKRFPSGSYMYNDCCDIKTSSWFNYSSLPTGETEIDDNAILELENSFRSAVSKCLKLDNGKYFLPLSSGYDSRRILALLNDLNVDFESATVRVFQKGHRDLDAKFASIMAHDLQFSHKVVDLPPISEYVLNDYLRRVVVDSESTLHTWYMSLLKTLPMKSSIVFDGLAGDVLGETGFEDMNFYQGDHLNKIRKICNYAVNSNFENTFNENIMPTSNTVKNDVREFLINIPDSFIYPDLAFLLTRTRRTISIGSQQILPIGHIVVFPYLDHEYVNTALRYRPSDKLEKSIQARCLEKYWPKLYAYGGSRSVSPEVSTSGVQLYKSQLVGRFKKMKTEILTQGSLSCLYRLLSNKSRLILLSACISEKALYSREWYFMGIMELIARQSRHAIYLEIKQ